ncbi:MAG: response regulator [Cyanobacteria bacterium P01_A01_bin.84]
MKILVVEDDELVAQALSAVLTHHNYAVEVASNGQIGWELVQAFDYDLIILDITLPKLDGISLCQQIRSGGWLVPIMLVTGCDSSHEKAVGLDAGADDYVVKPFEEEELVARVRALLRRGNVNLPTVLKWGALRLDPTSCEVSYDTQNISLTPKEYSLLELFLRNSRRVFSCGMILEHLWSYQDVPSEEAVRTHIKGLRMKLKTAGASGNLIETVYGIGYRLKPQEEKKRRRGNEKKIPGSQNSSSQTLLAIAGVWAKYQGRVKEQVNVLLQAAEVLKSGESLSLEFRSQAITQAHTLAGSLGTFGFGNGSKLARNVEHLLKADRVLEETKIGQLYDWVKAILTEIDSVNQPLLTCSIANNLDENPLVLIINAERKTPKNLIEKLVKQSAHWGLQTTISNSISSAREKLYQEHPNVAIADFNALRNDEGLSLLADFKNRKPPIPVIVLTEEADSPQLLEIISNSGNTILSKSASEAEILETATQLVKESEDGQARVLAVDDDPKVLEVLQKLLKHWGIVVKTLAEPHLFWETLETTKPDLLILDVKMPGLSGIELCSLVRNDSRWSELPILFLTVHSEANTVNQVFSAGADDFVSKPIVGPELVTRIVNRLERIKLIRRMTRVQEKQQVETTLSLAEKELENRVAERTAEQVEINQRLELELEQLRQSQAQLKGVVEIADDAIISIDSNQCITLFNQGAEKIFGYSASEVLEKPLDLLLPQSSVETHRHHVAEFGKSSNTSRKMGERQEIYGKRKDGSEFPAEASISKLKLADTIVYTVYLQDISQRKQIERMKDEFISVVSHELRTPLTSIHASLGMLETGLIAANSEHGKRLLQIATDSSERLVRLINDILDIERIESGKAIANKQICKVADLIAQAVNLVQPLADKAEIKLSIDNRAIQIQIQADCDRIIQTLTNLLSNAIKFSKSGDTIWLAALEQDSQVLFTVKDTGRGIPPDKIEIIFERFQQVDSSDSRNHEGTGLGLAICRSIIEMHGGQIWVESTLGVGSTFYFTLPMLISSSLSSI